MFLTEPMPLVALTVLFTLTLQQVYVTYSQKPLLINRIYGLGGRDYMPENAAKVIEELIEVVKTGKTGSLKEYIGVRE